MATASLDPFRGYATALTTQLPDAIRVLDPFHVVKLGLDCVDQVRRRVQQNTLGHRGRARAEDRIRGAKDTGLASPPLHDFASNEICCAFVALAGDLLAWIQPLARLSGPTAAPAPR